jgi:hypothetical protein
MKIYLLGILRKLLEFANNILKVKSQSKSPAELYLDTVSRESYEIFKDEFKNSYVFTDDESIRTFAINEAIKKFSKEKLFLEFGVYKGNSINLFAKYLKNIDAKIYGFDSFVGLKDEWITNNFHAKGHFNLNKNKPKILSNIELIDGWVEDTIDNFIEKNIEKKIGFVHFDMDTYSSTKLILEKIKKYLEPGAVILFDEFYGFPNWEKYEFKAFKEVFSNKEFKYIAFANRQACIRIN